jgi:hypothetical protein
VSTAPSSIAEFDQALLDEYARFRALLLDQPESLVQQRFAQQGVFPKLGWALIGIGEAEALARKDPRVLYETIARFVKCAHHCWGHADEHGLHWGGSDFCGLVVPSLYSTLIGPAYLASAFHCRRPRSSQGYGACVRAANLMLCIECPSWPHRDKAISQAGAFMAARSPSKVDRAFVGFLLGALAGDRAAIGEHLSTFSAGYLASDWGRHKPWTRPTFVQALITYAGFQVVEPVDAQTHRTLVSGERIELWAELTRVLPELLGQPHRFPEPLGFMNDNQAPA